MIKKLQKLKAKKGFTLVELIVVIAIIGVLAAILIPTMLGFVTSSRVTSANTTAAEIQKQINNFLTDADTAGYGMKKSNSAQANFTFKVDGDGAWSTTLARGAYAPGSAEDSAFKGSSTMAWADSTTGDVKANEGNKSDITDATTLMTRTLADVFPDLKGAYVYAYCEAGSCKYVAYSADGNEKPGSMPTEDDFKNGVYEWDGNTAGITSDGIILGTAPELKLGKAS